MVLVTVGGFLALRSEGRGAAVVLPRASPVVTAAAPAGVSDAGTPPVGVDPTPVSDEPTGIVVHAAGAVARPGVYRLGGGARVVDLLEAAGGAAAGADLSRINLAAPLPDGARVHFPLTGEDPPVELDAVDAPPPGVEDTEDAENQPAALVDINSADAAELEELPGIGPVTAAAIVRHREQSGPFRSVQSLQEVSGIGPVKFGNIEHLVTVGR